MSQNKTTVTETKIDPEELVEYTAPLLPGEERQSDVFVGVNGETVRFKRGVTVKLKRKFVEVLENAQTQEMEAYRTMRTAQDAGNRATAAM